MLEMRQSELFSVSHAAAGPHHGRSNDPGLLDNWGHRCLPASRGRKDPADHDQAMSAGTWGTQTADRCTGVEARAQIRIPTTTANSNRPVGRATRSRSIPASSAAPRANERRTTIPPRILEAVAALCCPRSALFWVRLLALDRVAEKRGNPLREHSRVSLCAPLGKLRPDKVPGKVGHERQMRLNCTRGHLND